MIERRGGMIKTEDAFADGFRSFEDAPAWGSYRQSKACHNKEAKQEAVVWCTKTAIAIIILHF